MGIIKLILKFLFAGAIIYWLMQSGKLDFSLISKSFKSGYSWLFAFILLLVQTCLLSVRWKLLLESNTTKKLGLLSTTKINWIGLFFNTFLPGAVTGDFIKLLYAKDLDPKLNKTFLVTSVIVDRILGLSGLLLILGVTTIFYYSNLASISPQMKTLLHFNLLLFIGAMGLIASLFAPKAIQTKILAISDLIPVFGSKINKTLTSLWIIGESKKMILKTIALSLAIQFITFTAFYLLTSPFYSKYIPLPYIITFIPIGFLAVAIPISPAGFGVGHAVFDKLFLFIGVEGGASFFNLYFLLQVSINLLGLIPYLLSNKKHNLKEAEKEFNPA